MNKKNLYLYVLLCEEDKYYVGQTVDLQRRFQEHLEGTGEGAAWTKIYKPIKFAEKPTILNDYLDIEVLENQLFLKYVNKHGWKNVRGGKYSYIDEQTHYKLIERYNKIENGRFVSLANQRQIELYLAARDKLLDFCPIPNHYYYYVLRLEQNKYFVGYTNKIRPTIRKHFYSHLGQWTKLYRPIELIEVIEAQIGDSSKQTKWLTLELMEIYGVENVRGDTLIDIDQDIINSKIRRIDPDYFRRISSKKRTTSMPGIKNISSMLELMLEGADPISGEVFNEDHFLFHESVQTNLIRCIEILSNIKKKDLI